MIKNTLKETKLLITFVFLHITLLCYSQSTQTFNVSGTYTVPAGVTSITVEAWGGGGKGGLRSINGGSGGGGGGAYSRKKITVTSGANYTVTVGTGSTSTSAGKDSWFSTSTTILAKGGNSVNNNITIGANGGAAGASIGDYVFAGGNGANEAPSKSGGGGGSSAGYNLTGVNSVNASGAIAPYGGGNGGNARSVDDGSGTIGQSPGGGGGGAYRSSSGTQSGGNGADGKVIITWGSQEIDVQGNNISITSGDTTPSGTDDTDFNSLDISSGAINKTFTIYNLGSNNLTVSSITVSGSSDFTITNAPSFPITILGKNSVTFSVSFDPSTVGVKNATISISNNDSNENPYTFSVKGEGIQTFYDSDGDGIYDNVDIDDDNDGILDFTEETNCRNVNGFNINYKFLNETFGSGARTTINTTYAATTSYLYENGGDLNDGEYTVGTSAQIASWASTYWYKGTDHTGNSNGRMALFNADYTPGIFYTALITGALINVPVTYSFWVLNLDRTDAPGISTRLRPNIRVEFRDLNDNLLTSITTGQIAPTTAGNLTGDWYNFKADLVFNVSAFKVVFINNETGGTGNDLAIDDIEITQTLCDRDGDGIADLFDLDADNDGIEDVIEAGLGNLTNGKGKIDIPWADANGNGLHDAAESAAALPALDSDGDGVPNYLDLDSDNDSLFDVDESGAGNGNAVVGYINGDGDINGDGVGDGPESEAFRLKDVNGDGVPELFGDGILDIYDYGTGTTNQYGNLNQGNSTTNPATTYLKDTDGDGIPDYLDTKSNGTTWDIENNKLIYLPKIFDDGNGKISGTADIDKDGILDTFDTNTAQFGSPRNINTKLFLDFDGRNDYGQSTPMLGGLANASLMAWIDLNPGFSGDGVIIGQNKFMIRITSAKKLEAVVNGTTLTFNTPISPFTSVTLNTSQWYHVAAIYNGASSLLKLYLNGTMVASQSISGAIASDTSLLTIGRDPSTVGPAGSKYFKGKIDEVRVFNVALSDSFLQRMVYQEINNFSSEIRGEIVPKNIATSPSSLPFTNLLRYYRMDAYKDDIIDDLTTPAIDLTGTKIYNHKNIYVQQAPMPFLTERTGTFAGAVNSPTKEIRGNDIMENDWSIVKVQHDITETANNVDLGMFVDPGKNIYMNNDTKIQNDWYLKLDGKIDLVGKSQLVQTTESDLDVSSSGSIERDQQGQSNIYNYNYWSSPVSIVNTTTNNKNYTVADVMKDGTSTTPKNINWISGYDGNPSSPISLARYWIYKFDNYSNAYANWVQIGETGSLRVGQGFSLKGSGTLLGTQNYTFVGKPNNGTISTNVIGANQLLLTGNPYASSIDATAFINDNASILDGGTLYFWEHYTTNNTHILRDYQGGYAERNLTGGVPPTSSGVDFISGLGSSTKTPKQFIPVGQSFFVNGNNSSGGNIIYKNSQRAFHKEDETAASNVMFKIKSNKNNEESWNNNNNDSIEKDTLKRIRLGYNSNNDYHRQVLLGFMNEKATAEMDYGYDGLNFDDFPNDMYFINGENQLVIQGEGFFDPNSSYPIGVKADIEGKVTFMIDNIENFDESQNMFIYDNADDSYHDIRNKTFEVIIPAGETNDRFSLRFTDKTLNVIDKDIKDDSIKIIHFQKRNSLEIINNSFDTSINKVVLYNMIGQSIIKWDIEKQREKNISLLIKKISSGMYITKIYTSVGEINKKIIIP